MAPAGCLRHVGLALHVEVHQQLVFVLQRIGKVVPDCILFKVDSVHQVPLAVSQGAVRLGIWGRVPPYVGCSPRFEYPCFAMSASGLGARGCQVSTLQLVEAAVRVVHEAETMVIAGVPHVGVVPCERALPALTKSWPISCPAKAVHSFIVMGLTARWSGRCRGTCTACPSSGAGRGRRWGSTEWAWIFCWVSTMPAPRKSRLLSWLTYLP